MSVPLSAGPLPSLELLATENLMSLAMARSSHFFSALDEYFLARWNVTALKGERKREREFRGKIIRARIDEFQEIENRT